MANGDAAECDPIGGVAGVCISPFRVSARTTRLNSDRQSAGIRSERNGSTFARTLSIRLGLPALGHGPFDTCYLGPLLFFIYFADFPNIDALFIPIIPHHCHSLGNAVVLLILLPLSLSHPSRLSPRQYPPQSPRPHPAWLPRLVL